MHPISDYLLVTSEIKSEKEGDLIDFSLLCQVSDRQVFISLIHATSRGGCVYDSNQDLGFFFLPVSNKCKYSEEANGSDMC